MTSSPHPPAFPLWRFLRDVGRAKAALARSWLSPPGPLRESASIDPERLRVLILSFVEWAGARQRPQHLAENLPPGWEAIYLSPRRIHRTSQVELEPSSRPGLRILEPETLPMERRLPWIHGWNDRLIHDAASRALDGRAPDAVMVNSPSLARPALRIPTRLLVYDLMDEFTTEGPAAARYRQDEERLLARAGLVFTGTQALFDSRAGRHPRLEFLPGGCDFAHFSAGNPALAPFGLNDFKRPIIGFFGALNERLDGALLERIARERAWTLALIGPRIRTCPPLPSGENVIAPGACPYGELPHALAAFDAAIIPYRTDGATRLVNPVKTLEYFAGGKPVISSDLPDVRRFHGEAALLARDAEEFVALIRRALTDKESMAPRIAAGVRMARERSWEQMAGQMAGRIVETLGLPGEGTSKTR